MRLSPLRMVLLLCIFLHAIRSPAQDVTTDICILGGSEAGFTAAVAAARMGVKVVLLEPTGHPGGMMVEGIVKDIRFGSSVVIGGIARELYTAIEKHYGRLPQFGEIGWFSNYEPHVAESAIEQLLSADPEISVIRHQRIREQEGVVKQGTHIQSVVLEDGRRIAAKVFIDASVEGHLLHAAGVPTETIREGTDRYGEHKNGIQTTNNYRQFEVAVDPYVVPGDPASGLIATIQPGKLGKQGAADKHIMGFCFRLCLTRDSSNRIDITKPDDYDPDRYEIYRRYLAGGGELFHPVGSRPGGKTDLGSWHDLSANLYGENWAYPTGNYATQDSIVAYHKSFTHGLLWFLQHDPAIDSLTHAQWKGWGLCRDEFTDNGGWPRRLYIRSARRMLSDYVITQHHTSRQNPILVQDPVAIAWWPPDTHHARRIVIDGKAYNEGFVFGGRDWRPFGISWLSLLPEASYCTNLVTPTCLSSSYVAYGAIRILPTFMMLGHSAGTAAALSLISNQPLHQLPYQQLRQVLLGQGQILTIPDDWSRLVDSE